MDMGLPYTPLIESLESEVRLGRFTAWSCAHPQGLLSAFFADEASPRDWLVDQNPELHPHRSETSYWMPDFDLASLTKPLLANAWIRKQLGTDQILWTKTPLASLVEARSEEGSALKKWASQHEWLTLDHLLSHTSGMRPWIWFGRALWQHESDSKGRRAKSTARTSDLQKDTGGELARRAQAELTAHILSLPIAASDADTKAVYSDLNYFLLARVIENLAMTTFRGWGGVIHELNSHWNSQFWHASLDPERSQRAIPFYPYVHSQVVAHVYENRKLTNHAGEFGAVHDTNANILASDFRNSAESNPLVSSHAGLFGNIFDLVRAIPFLITTQGELNDGRLKTKHSDRRFQWGFDTPSGDSSTAGLHHWPLPAGRRIFGHLGFTGTSVWMADDGQYHALLTNRTAGRRIVGSNPVPRILIFQKDPDTEPQCWYRWEKRGGNATNEMWHALNWREAYVMCVEHARMITRYWDRHNLRSPPDIAAVRRNCGRLLWPH